MLKIFLSTFALIFIAELGDKTQIAALVLSTRAQSPAAPWVIFAAGSLALISTTAIAVLAGSFASKWIAPQHVRWGAGSLFLAAGAWILIKG